MRLPVNSRPTRRSVPFRAAKNAAGTLFQLLPDRAVRQAYEADRGGKSPAVWSRSAVLENDRDTPCPLAGGRTQFRAVNNEQVRSASTSPCR